MNLFLPNNSTNCAHGLGFNILLFPRMTVSMHVPHVCRLLSTISNSNFGKISFNILLLSFTVSVQWNMCVDCDGAGPVMSAKLTL